MLLKINHITLLFLAIAIISCNKRVEAPSQEVMEQEQNRQISMLLAKTIHTTIEGMNILEIDSIFKNISRENFVGFTGNGMALNSYEETYSILKYMYGQMESYTISCFDEKYIILSETAAMYKANYNEELVGKSNILHHSKGVLTVVFQNNADSWEIVYIHTSSYPIRNGK